MTNLEGWLNTGVYAVFDGHVLEIFSDKFVSECGPGSTSRLHIAQIADLRLDNGVLRWTRHDGSEWPMSRVHPDCVTFATTLAQAVTQH